MTDLFCLGEPLFELNQQPDGMFLPGFGGDISNVAIAAARQGASSGILTRLGSDLFARDIRALWQREGVVQDHVIETDDKETGLYFVTHDEDGHHFTYRRAGSAASTYGPKDLPVDALQHCKIFYASGISLAISPSMHDAVMECARQVKNSGGLFAFDPNLRTALWPLDRARKMTHEVMKICDVALPGYDDAKTLTGLEQPEAIADFYHDLGASVVALTLGHKGVLLSSKEGRTSIAPHQVSAIDATGAGDCFNGAFLAACLAGTDNIEAATRANAAAALSVCGYGAIAAIPDLPKTLDFIKSWP
ncbi:sugar kinase [Cohaesibacter gelatinilyticus]|uniref:2-dehydro-3-deoxygluconokinase n=1 Tax=Cohaesibacter gelatinilyticus TaxID=372072 RepID=A0A285PBB7_9HYPH|nr:sugar kinase [Cohaesibacter gelatinilyticus]SNZ19025.1 2-dehydro-3-deoxygluconokinase [Cohaesibacter gelatinilyticus]